MKNRVYSFLVPWFMDGCLGLVYIIVPFLSAQFGVSMVLLGNAGAAGQTLRLLCCHTSAYASDKLGRQTIAVPATVVAALSCIAFTLVTNKYQAIACFVVAIGTMGAFYPPLQALIRDVSHREELAANTGAFNLGWCVGGVLLTLIAGWLITKGLAAICYTAAALAVGAGVSMLLWRSKPVEHTEPADSQFIHTAPPKALLLIARMGHFVSFFGFAITKTFFPQVGLGMHWPKERIVLVVAMLLIGQALGILGTNTSFWWRGKFWPQIAAQCLLLGSAVASMLAHSPLLCGTAFLGLGLSQGLIYTGSLYYGLAASKAKGGSAGTHEALIACGYITGSLVGGYMSKMFSPRAPYVLLAGLALALLVTTIILSLKHRAPHKTAG